MQVGKSKSQIQMEPNTGVTFEDVAGCDGSKQELTEVVDFLKNPAKYSALGAKIPRGAVLDSALVRPGRFDRRVPVDLPDVKGRREILKVHVRGKPLAADLDLNIVAKRTTGFSGAGLANLMNEAAIVAARNGKDVITYDEIDYAIDRLPGGSAPSARAPSGACGR